MREALRGHRRGMAAFVPFVGPALLPSAAYLDPGNYATNKAWLVAIVLR